jgi:hypothetical protein
MTRVVPSRAALEPEPEEGNGFRQFTQSRPQEKEKPGPGSVPFSGGVIEL